MFFLPQWDRHIHLLTELLMVEAVDLTARFLSAPQLVVRVSDQ